MALLHALWEVRARLGLTLEVGGDRSRAARRTRAAEVDLVARAGGGARAAVHRALRVDVAAARRGARGASPAGRRPRTCACGALDGAGAPRTGRARVALGHQADDQAETVLFRIVRGTGLAGLAGIPYRRDASSARCSTSTRARSLRYLRRRSIPFVEDPSNADARFARARIRHRLLPALAEENPRVVEALRRARGGGARRGRRRRRTPPPSRVVVAVAPARRRPSRGCGPRGGSAGVDVAGGRRVEVTYGEARHRAAPRTARRGRRRASGRVVIDGPGPIAGRRGLVELRDSIARERPPAARSTPTGSPGRW